MHYYLFFVFFTPFLLFSTENTYQLSVSQGKFKDKAILKWSAVPGAEFYSIERMYDTPKKTKRGKEIPIDMDVLAQNIKNTEYTDNSISFGMHKYIINAYQTNIEPISETKKQKLEREKLIEESGTNINIPLSTNVVIIASMTNTGYRKVSDKEFFLEFQKGIDSSLPRIRTMKMLNFFGEKKDGWRGGKLVYKTTGIIRKPFKVMINYTDFIDQSLKLNGTYEVQIYKLLSQEGKLVGTFKVDGIYKGTVIHNLIIKGGQSVGGTYDVQQEGGQFISLPWDITDHPLDDSQYEAALAGTLQETENKES